MENSHTHIYTPLPVLTECLAVPKANGKLQNLTRRECAVFY